MSAFRAGQAAKIYIEVDGQVTEIRGMMARVETTADIHESFEIGSSERSLIPKLIRYFVELEGFGPPSVSVGKFTEKVDEMRTAEEWKCENCGGVNPREFRKCEGCNSWRSFLYG